MTTFTDTGLTRRTSAASAAFRAHWTLYMMEGGLLGMFMVSACGFTALFEYPSSPVHALIGSSFVRRSITGLAMGATAVALIYSQWGKRSGAHMNPAVTLGFLRLGRIQPWDALFYILAQFIGGISGVAISRLLLGSILNHPSVDYAVTVPGEPGVAVAWLAEFAIAMGMMLTVLAVNRIPSLAPWTGYFAAMLVALYITFEAPLSGMSLNPARTFASATWAGIWKSWWIYFTAPIAGMLAAIELNLLFTRKPQKLCGKLSHCPTTPTQFPCNCTARSGIKVETIHA